MRKKRERDCDLVVTQKLCELNDDGWMERWMDSICSERGIKEH